MCPGGQIERNDAGRMIGGAGELGERRLERSQRLVFQVKYCKLAEPAHGIGADDPIRSSARIGRCTETPQQRAELSRH